MKRVLQRLGLAAVVVAAATVPSFAHLGHAEHGSFMAGLSHPLFGLDHVLAMVAVGLWAAMTGGRAVYLVPAAFVGMMGAGFALALTGVPLPFVEPAILASIVALGLLIAAAVKLPTGAGMAVVGLFAVFHGFAHGSEMGGAAQLEYGFGFAAATAFLHVTGIGLGLLVASGAVMPRKTGLAVARVLGAGAAAVGIGLALGAM